MNPLTPLIEQLCDGSQIDWDRYTQEHPESSADVDGLRRLAQVTGAFRQCVHEAPVETVAGSFHWGHLQAIELIGEGGFGLVYRAYDQLLDRDVALKLRRDSEPTLASTSAFIAEARRLAQVRHPNVLAVHGAGVHDNRVGLWADLLSGQTLAEGIRADGPLVCGRAVQIAEDVLRGLGAIHAAGMIHGDVKASNIMIEPSGHAVLMDFGAGADSRQSETVALAFQGSPLCMAPELLDGAAPTQSADLYSVGVLIHFMLTGGYPVAAESVDELRAAHTAGRHQTRRYNAALPTTLARLLERLLAQRPEQRPSAVQALERLLWLKDRPARRQRRLIVATVIGCLTLALAVSLIALQRVSTARAEAQAQFQRAEQERKRAVAVKDFVVEGVRGAAPMQREGVSSLLSMYRGLAQRVEAELGKFPEARAGMEFAIGRGLYDYGDHQSGIELAERGVAAMASLPTIDQNIRIESLESLASLYRNEQRLDEAETAIRQALSLAENGGDEQIQQAVALRARNLLANVLGDRGELVESLHLHQRVLADRIKLLGPESPRLAANYNNIGRKFESLERWPEALTSFERAESLLLSSGETDSIKVALVRAGIAQARIGLGQWDEGQGLFERVRQRYRVDYPNDHAYVRAADVALADLLRRRGHLDLARIEFDRLLVGHEDRVHLYYWLARGRVALAAQDWVDSTRCYRQALDAYALDNKLYRPFLQTALAWSQAQVHNTAGPNLETLELARQKLRTNGLQHTVEFTILESWISSH